MRMTTSLLTLTISLNSTSKHLFILIVTVWKESVFGVFLVLYFLAFGLIAERYGPFLRSAMHLEKLFYLIGQYVQGSLSESIADMKSEFLALKSFVMDEFYSINVKSNQMLIIYLLYRKIRKYVGWYCYRKYDY